MLITKKDIVIMKRTLSGLISASVGNGLDNKPEDIMTIKRNLFRIK